MKVKDMMVTTHLSQSFTFGSRHLHEDEDMDDAAHGKILEQKKSNVSYYESKDTITTHLFFSHSRLILLVAVACKKTKTSWK